MSKRKIEGGCMCGEIRYMLTTNPTHSTLCHCSDCRRASGAQSVPWITVPLQHFVIIQGEPKDYNSSASVMRTFCSTCGTPLTYRDEEHSTGIDITAGSLDNPEQFPPKKDLFVRDKLSWVEPSTQNIET